MHADLHRDLTDRQIGIGEQYFGLHHNRLVDPFGWRFGGSFPDSFVQMVGGNREEIRILYDLMQLPVVLAQQFLETVAEVT